MGESCVRPQLLSVLIAAAAICAVTNAAAQLPLLSDATSVTSVEIRGVEGVSMTELRNSLVTQPTRCRSIFFKPFCLVTGSSFFVERHELERAEVPRDALRIRVHLWRRGWRFATVATTLVPEDKGVAVVFQVNQGPETLLRSVTVSQTEPVLSDGQLRRARLPEEGEGLNLVDLDSARVRLLTVLGQRGYADAEIRDSVVVENSISARLEVVVAPGRRTTIEAIEVEGNDVVTDRTIRDALPIRPGRLYRAGEVAEAQRALYLTGMFSEAVIQLTPQADSAKTIQVRVVEAPFRLVRAGVGVNTADYLNLQGQFTRYNWFGGGRRLDVSANVGRLLAGPLDGSFLFKQIRTTPLPSGSDNAFAQPTWNVSARVSQPAFPSAPSSVGLGVFSHRRVEPGVVVDRGFGVNATATRSLGHRAPLSLSYQYELNTVLAGEVYFCVNYGVCDRPTIATLQAQKSLSPLSISGFVERVDDPLARTSGYTARLGLEHASAVTLSDFRYHRADAEITRDFRVGSGTFAARVRGGWVRSQNSSAAGSGGVEPEAVANLHPTKRFYAGGARSARGYAENQLGPRILTIGPARLLEASNSVVAACSAAEIFAQSCDPNSVPSSEFTPRPIGGTRVMELGLEYRRPFLGVFVGAVFVDAARVSDPELASLAEARSAITPGFGVRYRSPVGPVRVDLGFHPLKAEDLTVITQVNENGVARLIRLDTRKRYDPGEGNAGFFASVTNRLTLHLSIGEAF